MARNEIRFDNTRAYLTGPDVDLVRKALTRMAPGAEYLPSYREYVDTGGASGWNARLTLLAKDDSFPTGLVPYVSLVLNNNVELIDTRPIILLGTPVGANLAMAKLRDYQSKSLIDSISHQYEGMWWPRGVIQMATGGGKTLVACALIRLINLPTVFLVHRQNLMRQTHKVFLEHGIEAGMIGDSEVIVGTEDVWVCTIQTLQSWAKRDKIKLHALANRMRQVFVDEAHLVGSKVSGANAFARVTGLFDAAPFRWGLTATPFMRDEFSNLILEGATGPPIIETRNAELIAKGYLAKPEVRIYRMDHPNTIKKAKWPASYDLGITMNSFRNEEIAKIFAALPKPVLVLTQRIDHGQRLARIIPNVHLINGKVDSKERAKLVKELQAGVVEGIIASTVFDEGVDIPEIRAVIMAGGMKSAIKTLQRVGRGLRLAEGKDRVIIVDFEDATNRVLRSHSLERIATYKGEGFDVRKM